MVRLSEINTDVLSQRVDADCSSAILEVVLNRHVRSNAVMNDYYRANDYPHPAAKHRGVLVVEHGMRKHVSFSLAASEAPFHDHAFNTRCQKAASINSSHHFHVTR